MSKSALNDFLSNFKDIKIEILNKILLVELNRPKSLNSLSKNLFLEIKYLFDNISSAILKEKDIRCIILKGAGGNFSSGLDLNSDIITDFQDKENECVGRKGFWFTQLLEQLQQCMNSIENNPLPVICAIDGYALGGATSIMSCTDIRVCTKNAKFSVREIEIGLTADLGVLQRMFKQVGNQSLFRQYCFTGEIFSGDKALELGLVSKVLNNTEDMMKHAFELAKIISEKSPIVLWGVKKSLNFARENSLNSSLEMMQYLNSSLIQSKDIVTAVTATLKKEKKEFPKF